jgi:hypothetical protein
MAAVGHGTHVCWITGRAYCYPIMMLFSYRQLFTQNMDTIPRELR